MLGIVILHYKNIMDTVECLESIKKLDSQEKIVTVVVDNASLKNDEYNQLLKYTDNIIRLEKNIGFAKANNMGCKYLLEKYDISFIYVINNDTIINQKDTIEVINKIYESYKFDCLGPKIITNNGYSVNPFPAYKSLDEVNNRIKYTKKLIIIYENVFLRQLLRIYLGIKSKLKKSVNLKNGDTVKLNVPLHGCAIVFSKKYLERYPFPFYNETFLYHEEEFLYQRCIRDKLTFIYSPEIEIIHKEGRSLNCEYRKNNYDKLIFKNRKILESLTLLKKVIENNEEG